MHITIMNIQISNMNIEIKKENSVAAQRCRIGAIRIITKSTSRNQ